MNPFDDSGNSLSPPSHPADESLQHAVKDTDRYQALTVLGTDQPCAILPAIVMDTTPQSTEIQQVQPSVPASIDVVVGMNVSPPDIHPILLSSVDACMYVAQPDIKPLPPSSPDVSGGMDVAPKGIRELMAITPRKKRTDRTPIRRRDSGGPTEPTESHSGTPTETTASWSNSESGRHGSESTESHNSGPSGGIKRGARKRGHRGIGRARGGRGRGRGRQGPGRGNGGVGARGDGGGEGQFLISHLPIYLKIEDIGDGEVKVSQF